nr:MAG TPA: hypothetical protein [Caudoviricetes sp.]
MRRVCKLSFCLLLNLGIMHLSTTKVIFLCAFAFKLGFGKCPVGLRTLISLRTSRASSCPFSIRLQAVSLSSL